MAVEPLSALVCAASILFGSLKVKWTRNIKEFRGASGDYELSSSVKWWGEGSEHTFLAERRSEGGRADHLHTKRACIEGIEGIAESQSRGHKR